MESLTKRLAQAKKNTTVRDPKKLKLQQAYYKKLSKSGVSVKQSYSVRAIAAI
jgi:hypothetical protein